MRPLEGIRVVALEHAVAAPICSRHMADLGAEVIKVERPGEGDFARSYDSFVHGQASFFVWLNRGKRSIALDLKHPEAAKVLTGCSPMPTCCCRTSPPAQPRVSASAMPTSRRAIPAGRLRHLRLRRERPVRPEEGLRPADPGGVRPDQRHRHRGHAIARRDLGRRHRHRHVCAVGHPRRPGPPRADRRGRQRQDRHAGRTRRVDDLSDVPRRICQLAAAALADQPSGAGALWRAPDQGRPGDLRPAERARMGDVLRQGAGAAGDRHRSAVPRQQRAARASPRADRG